MKKLNLFVVFFLFLIFVSSCSSNKITEIYFPKDFAPDDININNDGSYVFLKDSKLYYAYGQTKTEITAPITEQTIFTSYYDKIYVCVENKINVYNTKNELLDTITPTNGVIYNISANYNNLVIHSFIQPDDKAMQATSYFESYNLKTKTKEQFQISNNVLITKQSIYDHIAFVENYVEHDQAIYLYDFDLKSNSVANKYTLPVYPTDIAFDSYNTNIVYIFSEQNIIRYALDTSELEIIAKLDNVYSYMTEDKIFAVSDYIYIFRKHLKAVTTIKIDNYKKDNDLVLYSSLGYDFIHDERISKSAELYKEKYPDRNFKLIGVPNKYYETSLEKRLESKTMDFDLFVGNLSYINKYYKTGAVSPYDLSKLEVDTTKIFSNLLELNKENNQLYGMPLYYNFKVYSGNPNSDSIFKSTTVKNWDTENFLFDALDVKKGLYGNNKYLLYAETPVLEVLFEQFMTKDFTRDTFDKETFLRLLSLNKNFYDGNLYFMGTITEENMKDFYIVNSELSADFLWTLKYYNPPTIGDGYKYLTTGASIFKNVYSTKEEYIYDFLNIYLSEDVQKTTATSPIYSDLSIYNPGYSIMQPLSEEEVLSNFETYTNMVNNLGTSKLDLDKRAEFMSIVKRCVLGEISKDVCFDMVLELY